MSARRPWRTGFFYSDYDVPEAEYRVKKARLSPYEFTDPDDALGMARNITARGGVAWEIESDDGTTLGRREIACLLRVRGDELVGQPEGLLGSGHIARCLLLRADLSRWCAVAPPLLHDHIKCRLTHNDSGGTYGQGILDHLLSLDF